jgi:hypothetical protein
VDCDVIDKVNKVAKRTLIEWWSEAAPKKLRGLAG